MVGSRKFRDEGQDETFLEGKIIAIDKLTKKYQLVSKGHRNPQGLFFHEPSLIINSEHGPKGGDEVNLNYMNDDNANLSNFGWQLHPMVLSMMEVIHIKNLM